MKTIGQVLENARKEKKISLQELEETTKIKESFIESIEKEKWDDLPPFPTVLGFVKSISSALGIDEKMAVAVFKRDYPPKKLSINRKPDLSEKPSWNPKQAFILGISILIILILGYLGFQYKRFVSPPMLSVQSPVEGQVVNTGSVLVFGSTDTDAKITVNNQPVLVGDDGKFTVNIEVSAETKEITVTAQSRSGKVTTVSRKIEVPE
jgi:transcriptional regulator with XRE-family HTH domain